MKKVIILILSLLFVFLILPFTITIATHSYYFAGRTEYQNEYFEYLSSKDPNFTRTKETFKSNNDQTLTGFFYSQSDLSNPKALLIWVHGLNVNHENYLAEIQYLTKLNYLVFSYDNTGVNHSEGNGLKGLIQSPLDLEHALNHLYDLDLYNDIPNILIGHSWGGFSVSCVSGLNLKKEVDGIISLGGFYRNINVLAETAQYYVGGIAKVLIPYLTVYENMLFSEYKYLNGVYGLSKSTCDVLIIHSKDDVIVHHETNYLVYEEEFKDNERFTLIEYENFGHQLTMDKTSYDRIHDIMHHEQTEALIKERHELLANLNFTVLNDITTFLQNIIINY